MELLWGDLHNHCDISYGMGTLDNALMQARRQLDFCSVIGHATWHDMPKDSRWSHITSYHRRGFQRLSKQWDEVCRTVEAANRPNEFVTFHGFEAHSSRYGDRHVISPNLALPLIMANNPKELLEEVNRINGMAMAIPHHIGYVPGYRGIDWEMFGQAPSPVVEVYSKHGCAMDEWTGNPYLHTMGPRDGRNTVVAGLEAGHRFGFIASSDHHAGYPGSYGDGLVGLWAHGKTREAIWEALQARRTYAVTGDKIQCQFQINHLTMGMEGFIEGPRDVFFSVRGSYAIDRVIIYKNGRPWSVNSPPLNSIYSPSSRYKIRVEFGWGDTQKPFLWQASCSVRDGYVISVESQFRGPHLLSPDAANFEVGAINGARNVILEQTPTVVSWTCETRANLSTLHSQTSAVVLEVEGSPETELEFEINGKAYRMLLNNLIDRGYADHVDSYCSEAFLIHRAIPEAAYYYQTNIEDNVRSRSVDVYFLAVEQKNNQAAWVSPIFVKNR